MIDWQKLRTVMGRLLFITVFNPDRDTFVEMRNPTDALSRLPRGTFTGELFLIFQGCKTTF